MGLIPNPFVAERWLGISRRKSPLNSLSRSLAFVNHAALFGDWPNPISEADKPLDLVAALRTSINAPSLAEVEAAKLRALAALTRATREMAKASDVVFVATKRRAERRKEALAAGASIEEVQEAIKAGHRTSSGG